MQSHLLERFGLLNILQDWEEEEEVTFAWLRKGKCIIYSTPRRFFYTAFWGGGTTCISRTRYRGGRSNLIISHTIYYKQEFALELNNVR